jgi:hypothetical protein
VRFGLVTLPLCLFRCVSALCVAFHHSVIRSRLFVFVASTSLLVFVARCCCADPFVSVPNYSPKPTAERIGPAVPLTLLTTRCVSKKEKKGNV